MDTMNETAVRVMNAAALQYDTRDERGEVISYVILAVALAALAIAVTVAIKSQVDGKVGELKLS